MTVKTFLPSLGLALILAALAELPPLHDHLPSLLAYFTVALLASVATLLILPGAAVRARPATNTPSGGSGGKEQGNVKWFSANKGFGFITRDNGEDVFVHFRAIAGSGHRVLREGQRVEFVLSQSDKGPQAEDVVSLDRH